METRKEYLFDKPMILSLLAVCLIILFIWFSTKNKSIDTDKFLSQRDSVEIVVQVSPFWSSSGVGR